MQVVSQLVIAGSHVTSKNLQGLSAGHLAARHGFFDVVEKLLLAGFPVDLPCGTNLLGSERTTEGCTVLHVAAANGHFQVSRPTNLLLPTSCDRSC